MRSSNRYFSRKSSLLIAFLVVLIGLGILARPSGSQAQSGPVKTAFYSAGSQDASQEAAPSTTTPTTPPKPAPVILPDGDGKPIAEAACQACHRLTNLTRAHKSLDEWRDTVDAMMDRGANVPKDKVETLVQYLAKNFAPKSDTSPADTQAAPVTPPPAMPPADVAPGAPPQTRQVDMPDGDGKAIAVAACQACHRLTNLTRAHKNLDEWRDTVDTMIDRGANVSKDQVETLVQYLAKNFGPKP